MENKKDLKDELGTTFTVFDIEVMEASLSEDKQLPFQQVVQRLLVDGRTTLKCVESTARLMSTFAWGGHSKTRGEHINTKEVHASSCVTQTWDQ